MAKRRITAQTSAKAPVRQVPAPGTTLWSFFGNFWRKLSQEQQEQRNISEIEELTRRQLQTKQSKTQLRLKRWPISRFQFSTILHFL